jgi:CRP/FNR family transcriptional regulator, cyclic AMP receptor protein
MSANITPDVLRNIYILQDLREEEIKELLAATTPREFSPDSVIIREGEPGNSMFILYEGKVGVSKNLDSLQAGDLPEKPAAIRLRVEESVALGEMALLEDGLRSATVTSITPCQVLELSKTSFLKLISTNHALGVKILLRLGQRLSQRLRQRSDAVVKLAMSLAFS